MPDFHYENPKLAEIYDLDSPWSTDREFYLSLAGSTPKDILDLGCGTGLICDAYAERKHFVTGVDPAIAMLDVAHRKRHGTQVEWVHSSAQEYTSEKLYDLIIMTGHAFQVLLSDADILKTFFVMQKHLKSNGKIVFETRNPDINWIEKWSKRKPYFIKGTNILASWHFINKEDDFLTFEWHYNFPQETLVSKSVLNFPSREKIENLLSQTELTIENVFGDWDRGAFDKENSEEIIFVLSLA